MELRNTGNGVKPRIYFLLSCFPYPFFRGCLGEMGFEIEEGTLTDDIEGKLKPDEMWNSGTPETEGIPRFYSCFPHPFFRGCLGEMGFEIEEGTLTDDMEVKLKPDEMWNSGTLETE